MPESPLSEAPASSLDDLFSRDPLDLSAQDLSMIVAELRRQRDNWKAAEAEGKTVRPRKVKPAPIPLAEIQNLSLDDLGL